MAADEAMLETAANSGVASMRFYHWSVPTFTLGYFQQSSGREDANLTSLPWVRRSTGGAGIVHHHELTYSLVLPSGSEWKSSESWICRFHRLILDVLSDFGIAGKLVVCGEELKVGEVLCFLHQTPGDLVIAGSKVAGSAQRKFRGALLQHGSLLLRQSEFAPQLLGMEDLAARDLFSPSELANLLTTRFTREVAEVKPGPWTSEELERIPIIAAEKYANPEWNEKR